MWSVTACPGLPPSTFLAESPRRREPRIKGGARIVLPPVLFYPAPNVVPPGSQRVRDPLVPCSTGSVRHALGPIVEEQDCQD